MIYIIAGTQDEATWYVKKKDRREETEFVPDSDVPLVCETDATIIFVGSYKKRKDILERLLESRDLLLVKIANLERKLVYDDNGDIVTQTTFNEIAESLSLYRQYLR